MAGALHASRCGVAAYHAVGRRAKSSWRYNIRASPRSKRNSAR